MGAEEPAHEGDDLTADQYRIVVLVLATIITVVTIAFEMLQHKLQHALSADFRPILDHLYSELTVMGFIGLVLFGSSRLGIIEIAARRIVGPHDQPAIETMTSLSEDVHVVVFFVAIIFLLQTLVLALIGTLQKRYWRRYERFIEGDQDVERVVRAYAHANLQDTRGAIKRFFGIGTAEHLMMYHSLRREFVRPDLVHRASRNATREELEQLEKHLAPTFNFAEYMSLAMGGVLGDIVDIGPATWLILWILFVIFWSIVHTSFDAGLYAILAFENFLVVILFFIARKLALVVRELTSPYCYHLAEHHAELSRSLPIANERSPLLRALSSQVLLGIASGMSRVLGGNKDFTPTLEQQTPPYMLRPAPPLIMNPLLRRIYGLHGSAQLDHHERLFWFGCNGRAFIMTFLRIVMVLLAMCTAVFAVIWASPILNSGNESQIVITFFFALLPVLAIPLLLKRCLVYYVYATHVELMRDPRLIMKVIRAQKTRHTLQVLRLISSLHAARRGPRLSTRVSINSGADEEEEEEEMRRSLPRRVSEVDTPGSAIRHKYRMRRTLGETFDSIDKHHRGYLDNAELGSLLIMLGIARHQVEANEIVRQLDADNSGTISKSEFMDWIESHIDMNRAADPKLFVANIFSTLDHDGSGCVTAAELMQSLQALGQDVSVDDVREIIAEIDMDGDGKIGREEFEHAILTHYNTILG